MDNLKHDYEYEDETFDETREKKEKRDTAIKMLLIMYQEVDPSGTAEDVEFYIRSLKTQYVRMNSLKRIKREYREKFVSLRYMFEFQELDDDVLKLKYPRITNLGPYPPPTNP